MARRTAKVALPGSFTEKWPATSPADGSYMAEDLFTIARISGGFQVKHFADEGATVPCCNVSVEVTAADRVGAGSDVEAEMNALHRCNRSIQLKHGRKSEGAAA
jgi:hypothetical protein